MIATSGRWDDVAPVQCTAPIDHGLNLRPALPFSEALVMLDCALGLGALHSHPRLSAVRSHHPLFLIELEQVRMYRAARGAA